MKALFHRHDWLNHWSLTEHFPGGSVGKDPPANAEVSSSIPGSKKSPGERDGNPLQHSCLGNAVDRSAWGLQSSGCKRLSAGHDLVTKEQQHLVSWIQSPAPLPCLHGRWRGTQSFHLLIPWLVFLVTSLHLQVFFKSYFMNITFVALHTSANSKSFRSSVPKIGGEGWELFKNQIYMFYYKSHYHNKIFMSWKAQFC